MLAGNPGSSGVGTEPVPIVPPPEPCVSSTCPPAPAGGQVEDTQGSGGGTIGTGSVPTPDEPGFSANNQGPMQ